MITSGLIRRCIRRGRFCVLIKGGIESPVIAVHRRKRAYQSVELGTDGQVPVEFRLEGGRTSAYFPAVMAQGDVSGKMEPPALPCWASAGILQVQAPLDDDESACRHVSVRRVVVVAVPSVCPC